MISVILTTPCDTVAVTGQEVTAAVAVEDGL